MSFGGCAMSLNLICVYSPILLSPDVNTEKDVIHSLFADACLSYLCLNGIACEGRC